MRSRRNQLQSQINVVPYIDVMLVLLVIFMVTAPLISQAVIDLPSAGDIAPGQSANALEILMPEEGGYTVKDHNFEGDETSFADLPATLNHLVERKALFPDAPILIAADKDLPYGRVVEILGALHDRGLTNFGLVAKSKS